jgi:hypothetical protein
MKIGEHKVTITNFYQTRIYRGLLMGLPSKGMNDGIIKGIKPGALKRFGQFAEILPFHLVEPKRTPIEIKMEDWPKRNPSGRKLEEIPPVLSVAIMESSQTVKNDDEMYSACLVAWFQDEVGAIDEDVIKDINWEKIAKDFSD